MSARFLTGRLPDGSTAWASIDEASLCTSPLVAERRFPAFLAPFLSEQAARDALTAAGAEEIQFVSGKANSRPCGSRGGSHCAASGKEARFS